jgi:L-arabinose transport system substrate-binding protein
MKHPVLKLLATLGTAVALLAPAAHAADEVKIGFLVKQAEEPWFQDEWRFAEQAAKEKGFKLVKIGAPSGDKLLSAIDNLAAQHAQGFIVCVPDVKLGPAVVARAKQSGLKVMTVDDRLIDGAGKPIEDVPHMGISAYKIGQDVGQMLVNEMKKRGWNPAEVGAIKVSFDQLPTAKERTDGAVDSLSKAGFPAANILNSPQQKNDTEAAFNATNVTITKNPKFKHWIAFGLNDEAALGAVRALEGKGFKADSVIAVGIGGSASALNEFAKAEPTGLFGTVLISPKRHGYETALNMYEWIKNGKQPEKLILTSGFGATRENIKAMRKEAGLE